MSILIVCDVLDGMVLLSSWRQIYSSLIYSSGTLCMVRLLEVILLILLNTTLIPPRLFMCRPKQVLGIILIGLSTYPQ